MSSLTTFKWFQLNTPWVQRNVVNTTSINQHEFIIVTHLSIQKFNIITNQWTPIKCDEAYYADAYHHIISFCSSTQRLFFVFGNRMAFDTIPEHLRTLDIISGKSKKIKIKSDGLNLLNEKFCSVHIDGKMHIIGGEPPLHLEYTNDYQSFEKIHDFRKDELIESRICSSTAIYVPSKQMIVLIGGYDNFPTNFVGVWIYSLVTREWKKLSIDFNLTKLSAVLTSDEKHIIIVGGGGERESSPLPQLIDSIYVLRMNDFDRPQDFVMKESRICFPLMQSANIAITGGYKDEILVTGYVKMMFKIKEFKELTLPPVYMIQIIERYFNMETLHWIDDRSMDDHTHFAIGVKEILTNLEKD